MLCNEQYYIDRMLAFTESRITELVTELNNDINMQSQLNNGVKNLNDLVKNIKNGDFSIFNDRLSQKCMKAMYKAIQNIEGAEDYFKQSDKLDYDNNIIRAISAYPDVDDCGHSGMSMSWTLANFREIYQNGWDTWVFKILLGKGVGWNQIDLETAFKYNNESCCVYHLQHSCLNGDYKLMKSIIESKVIPNEWDDLAKYILDNTVFKLDDYVKWAYYCADENKHGLRYQFTTAWNKYYPRTLNFELVTDEQFYTLIKKIWELLPFDFFKFDNNSSTPTFEEISNFLSNNNMNLNNKYLFWIKKVSDFDPFYLDKKLGHVGTTVELLNAIIN